MKVTAKCSEARHPRERPLGRMGALILVLAVMVPASAQAMANRGITFLYRMPIAGFIWSLTRLDCQEGKRCGRPPTLSSAAKRCSRWRTISSGSSWLASRFSTPSAGLLSLARRGTGMWYPWSKLSPGAEVAVSLPPFATDSVHGAEGSMAIGGRVEVPAGVSRTWP